MAAAYSKRRRDDRQPLPPTWFPPFVPGSRHKAPECPLWGNLTKHTADMIRHDLEAAGIAYRDDNGRVADFHSLRGTYISLIVSAWAASVKTAQTLARHSTPSLTIGIYAKASVHDLAGAVESLPDLTRDRPEPEAATLAATGTDGQPIRKLFAHYLPTGGDGKAVTGQRRNAGGTERANRAQSSMGPQFPVKQRLWTPLVGIIRPLTEAEGVGFKPTDRRNLSTVFKTVPIDHSGTPPEIEQNCRRRNGKRIESSAARGSRKGRSLADLVDDVFGDVDRHVDGHGQGDGVAGTRVDLDELAVVADAQLGEIGVLAQLVDVDVLQLAAQQLDRVRQQVVSQRALGRAGS